MSSLLRAISTAGGKVNCEGAWHAALPADARSEGAFWHFTLPESGTEPLLRALIEGDAGILSLSIERPGLHDAFVAIAGEAAAIALEETKEPAKQTRGRR